MAVPKAYSHFGERYGLGVEGAASLMTLTTRCTNLAHAAYINPALLGCLSDGKIRTEFSFVATVDKFNSINGVMVSSPDFPTDPTQINTPSGSVNTNYPNHRALQIGLAAPLPFSVLKKYNVTLGATVHFNTDHLASFNAAYAAQPLYALYEKRDHKFAFAASVGAEIIPNWAWFGMGGQFYFTTGVAASMVNSQAYSAGQTAGDIDPRVSLIMGVRARILPSHPLFVSLVYHQDADQNIALDALTDIVVSGGGASAPYFVTSVASVYHEPHRLRLGVGWEDPDRWSVETVFIAEFWKSAHNSRDELSFTNPTKLARPMNNQFRNTVLVHTGGRYQWRQFEFMGGFGWQPRMVNALDQAENELDTDKLVFGLGMYYALPWWNTRVGVSYQLQHLLSETVLKTSAAFVGAPGYTVGGNVHLINLGIRNEF